MFVGAQNLEDKTDEELKQMILDHAKNNRLVDIDENLNEPTIATDIMYTEILQVNLICSSNDYDWKIVVYWFELY